MIKLFQTRQGVILESEGKCHALSQTWDQILNTADLAAFLKKARGSAREAQQPQPSDLLAPLGTQEIWAAGVTYLRSRVARMEEAKSAGGGDFYDRVYSAPRPELFFKATPHRVVGQGGKVRLRADSKWNVPEPELTLAVNSRRQIVGYTIGNDMSSRDIEGENPLYLPQAKVYDGSCALGPCVLVHEAPLPRETEIRLEIQRGSEQAFSGKTALTQMKRELQELVDYLYRDNSFPNGCFLLTGTGIVPPDSFTLQPGDEVRITIEPIGTLKNIVA